MNARMLLRDPRPGVRAARRAALGLAALALLALPPTPLRAAGPPARPLSPAERGTLEAHAAGLIAETLERRAVRPIAPKVLRRDAAQLARTLGDDQLRDLFAVNDAGEVVDRALAAPRTAASGPTLGDSYSDLLFVPLAPCRVIDTRQGSAGGPLAAGETRGFVINGSSGFVNQGGNAGGCGVPSGAVPPQATAVVLNLIAVSPSGPGDLRAWAYDQPEPLASVLNYAAVTGLNIANGVIVPVAGTGLVPDDIKILAEVHGTHVVADITGYFTRFPVENFQTGNKAFTQTVDNSSVVSLTSTDVSTNTCIEINECTVTVPTGATGRVDVQAWVNMELEHINGTPDQVDVGLKPAAPTNCADFNETVNAADFEVPDVVASDPSFDYTMRLGRTFFQSSGVKTYYVNAGMVIGASAGDRVKSSRMICTFYPQ
jgi:hypothetical protein